MPPRPAMHHTHHLHRASQRRRAWRVAGPETYWEEGFHNIHDGPRSLSAPPVHRPRRTGPNVPTALTDPLLDPSCRCEHAAPSLPIESDTSMLMAADSSISAPYRPAQQARQHAPSLPAHLCFCMLLLAPAMRLRSLVHALASADRVVARCALIGAASLTSASVPAIMRKVCAISAHQPPPLADAAASTLTAI